MSIAGRTKKPAQSGMTKALKGRGGRCFRQIQTQPKGLRTQQAALAVPVDHAIGAAVSLAVLAAPLELELAKRCAMAHTGDNGTPDDGCGLRPTARHRSD